MSKSSDDHGTVEGWKRHQQRRDRICARCAVAREAYLGKVAQMRGGQAPRAAVRHERLHEATVTPLPADCVLSAREWQVAVLAAQGLSNEEVGAALNVTSDTVKTHLRGVFGKLGTPTRTHLAVLIYRKGWLPADLADGETMSVPRELFNALARVAHLAQYSQAEKAQALAQRVATYLPPPRTRTP